MKKRLIPLLCLLLCAALLAGCQITPAPGSTVDTTAQPKTTAPAAEVKVTYVTLCDLLDEAQAYLETNEAIQLRSNFYTDTFVRKQKLAEENLVSLENGLYSLNTENIEQNNVNLRYLVFLSFITERYPEYIEFKHYALAPEIIAQRDREDGISFSMLMYTDYPALGYNSIREYMEADVPLSPGTAEFTICFDGPRIYMDFMDGEYKLEYRLYAETGPSLYYGTATEPSGISGPKDPGYTGDGIPPT